MEARLIILLVLVPGLAAMGCRRSTADKTVDSKRSSDRRKQEMPPNAPEQIETDRAGETNAFWEVPTGQVDNTFHVGPYLGHTTATAVAISWETVEKGTTVVEYGLDAGYGQSSTGQEGTIHHALLTGLEPATVYHYRACTGSTCSADLTFATAPGPERPFRFAVYGDSRSDPAMHSTVVESMLQRRPAIVFNTGDIVNLGDQWPEYKAMFFDPLRGLGHFVPVYVAIGNHEWKGEVPDRTVAFREYFVFPEDDGVPVPELSYTVTYGNAFFLVLDNTLDGLHFFQPVGSGPGPPLWVWLNQQASSEKAQQARWRFAFFHYPPHSPCHEDWGMIAATREHVIPLLQQHGFHGVFTGHVHSYERHDFQGLPVLVTGGGGAGLQDEGNCVFPSETLVLRKTVNHHVAVELGESSATVEVVDVDGQLVDTLQL